MNSNDLKDSKNDFTLEYNESNKKINFPNDISKVEKINEEEIPPYKSNKNLTREQRLQEIKVKYLEMENEGENENMYKNEEENKNEDKNKNEEENKKKEEKK